MDRQSETFYQLMVRYRDYLGAVNAPMTVRDATERIISALSREKQMDPVDLELVRSFVEDMDTGNPEYETVLETLKEYEERLNP